MKADAKTVLDAALALPVDKRAEIAERLLSSLDGPEPTPEEQTEIDALWAAEVERRMRELEDGTAEPIPLRRRV
jgi:putative addiction module component (TIGR02574 family)